MEQTFVCSIDGSGNAATKKKISAATAERFYQGVALQHDGDECLIWPFGKTAAGYAQITMAGERVYVHRRLCIDAHGEPPSPKHEAAHSCGNGHLGCVNKAHLSWKTHKENMDDMELHGTRKRGNQLKQAKLSRVLVEKAMEMSLSMSQGAIAKELGVNQSTVSRAINGRTWVLPIGAIVK